MKSEAKQKSSPRRDDFVRAASRIRRHFDGSQRVLVASHVDPDGDSVGTQLAFAAYLGDLGKEAFLVRTGVIPEKYMFLAGADQIPAVNSLPRDFSVDTALVLECPTIDRLGDASRFLKDGVTVINLDHHRDNRLSGDSNWVDVLASSVGEMAVEYFLEVGYEISRDVAEQLYTAIMTDTGRFRFSSTSGRTMQIIGKLIEAGADPRKIADRVYYNMRPSTMRLMGKVLNGIEFYDNGRLCLLTLTNEMLIQAGADQSESEGLVDFTLFCNGVDAGALLREIDANRTKVSLRSKDGINVAELAARMGGGGHYNASGCTMPLSLADAKKKLIELFREVEDGQA